MVKYGVQEPGEEPTNPHVYRKQRKYRQDRIETATEHVAYERGHGGESPKRRHKKEQTHARGAKKNSAKP